MRAPKLKVGDEAPNFELLDQNEQKHNLSMYMGQKVVLYFYPKDDTPGCTKEACSMRDNYSAFKKAGMVVLGVSADSYISHKNFAKKYSLQFPLLSDDDHSVLEKYGAWKKKNLFGKIMMGIERKTFIIDENGRIMKIYPKVNPSEHAQEILKDVDKLK
jgi:thioredoxin-dependent peroxiredoxin